MIVMEDHTLHTLQETLSQAIQTVTPATMNVLLVDIQTPAIPATILYAQCALSMLSVKYASITLSPAHTSMAASACLTTIMTPLTTPAAIPLAYDVTRPVSASSAGQDMWEKTVQSHVADMV